jgi:hypothetical protein
MPFALSELLQANFRTSRAADELNDRLRTKLGMPFRYGPARLAIARSLALPEAPPLMVMREELGKPIKGDQLFGKDLGVWAALVTQRTGQTLERREFEILVGAHWHRGATLLWRGWEEADGDFALFLRRLCDYCGLRATGESSTQVGKGAMHQASTLRLGPVTLRLGEVGVDLASGEPVLWVMNGPGRSPHIAATGTLGTGETRIAMGLLRQMREQSGCAVLAFDFKGDLAENPELAQALGATVVNPPRAPVPLDVLAVAGSDAQAVEIAAMRFRDSFAGVMTSRPGGVQKEALREAARRALARRQGVSIAAVRDALIALYEEEERKADSVTATFNELCALPLFTPEMEPNSFFAHSWIIDLHGAPESAQRLVAFLVFDALDAWLKTQKDAPLDPAHHRQLRIVLAIDEARRVLGFEQPSLVEIVRMSRSKGGAVVLVSQSPDDFAGEDEDFLGNIGLVFSFRTNAKPGSLQRIFGEKVDLAGLPDGVCVTRLPGEAKRVRPLRVQAWR